MALQNHTPTIHHSDHGVQYAAIAYTECLSTAGGAISMASIGEPTENGDAECLMRTIKEEEVSLTEYAEIDDARRHIGPFLTDENNTKRPHSSLGYLTPEEFQALDALGVPITNVCQLSVQKNKTTTYLPNRFIFRHFIYFKGDV